MTDEEHRDRNHSDDIGYTAKTEQPNVYSYVVDSGEKEVTLEKVTRSNLQKRNTKSYIYLIVSQPRN